MLRVPAARLRDGVVEVALLRIQVKAAAAAAAALAPRQQVAFGARLVEQRGAAEPRARAAAGYQPINVILSRPYNSTLDSGVSLLAHCSLESALRAGKR